MEYYEEKPRARDEYYQSPPASASPFAFAPPPLSRPSITVQQSEPIPYYPQRPAQIHHNTYPGVYRDDRQGSSTYYRQEPRQMYPPAPPGYYSADMPRSVSYNYTQPYVPALPPLARHTSESSIGGSIGGVAPSLGYSFANRLPLVDRPFKCDECVQSFNRNHDLKRHKRIHLSVKPFGCDKCGKTFSRKDALRRHWLVKGCRGEDGATAPITPTYPLNGPIPPTPPSLMSRQASDASSHIITPDEAAAREEAARREAIIDPSLGGKHDDGSYFDGVVGLRRDGTALIERDAYRYPPSPSQTYQRSVRLSPTQPQPQYQRSFSPVQEKPSFAMPFAPGYQEATYTHEMEKQPSDEQWQPSRWHRPSFPFPPPPGANYNYAPGSPVHVNNQFAQ